MRKTLSNIKSRLLALERKIPYRTLNRRLSDIEKKIEKNAKHQTEAIYRQTTSYYDLRGILGFDHPIPALRGYAISPDLALAIWHELVAHRPGKILELGSGFSSVVIAEYCRRYGAKAVSLDHEDHYAGKTRSLIEQWGLSDYIDIHYAPLKELDGNNSATRYYSLTALESSENTFDFAFIDGPPRATDPEIRGHFLPSCRPYLVQGCRVLLDDYAREGERTAVRRWVERGLVEIEYENTDLEKQAVLLNVR